ncbi:MAG: hypothetical protein GWO08_19825, partial [Gammaproteobacteria bacterium]|nr:hypothetical protein [Gammaproteobacteria bacterium]
NMDNVYMDVESNIQMTAHADLGGSNKDISQIARWNSADTNIFTVDSRGLVSGIAVGGPAGL